jgi:hypothetical protein
VGDGDNNLGAHVGLANRCAIRALLMIQRELLDLDQRQ